MPQSESDNGYFVLSAWCTVEKAWLDLDAFFASAADAEKAAVTERGIYRVI